ncbi:MAG: XRE family transcriptional regulator [Lachnospiraceae bacterium]|nr:XRE family transcriptional regulator [Lachnospiraceae bacterium]
MGEKSTDELRHEIKHATDMEDYLSRNREHMLKESLSEHLHMLLSRKNLRRADVIRGSLLGRAYVYRIFAGDKIPSRDKLIALAFGLQLSEEETQKMLKLSGSRELYARDERDALILFALQRDMTIMDVNELLIDHAFPVLDTAKE